MRPTLFLALLLVLPFYSYGDSSQIKELKCKKETELSDLGRIIAEKYKYAQSIRQDAIDILDYQAYKKGLNQQEIKELGCEIDKELDAFIARFNISDISGFLIAELFKKSEDKQLEEDFDAVKFFLIAFRNEYRVIKSLIQKYEILEQERRELNQKLIASQG